MSAIIIYCLLILYQFCLSEMENTGVPVIVVAPTRTLVSQGEKTGKFTGVNFKGWQQRVFFWLTTLGLQKFISEDTQVYAADIADREKFIII